jgi:DNA polymerase-1
MCEGADQVCVTARGAEQPKILVVGRLPNSGSYQKSLERDLLDAGFDLVEIAFTSALKCRNFEVDANKTDLKTCKQYLDAEIELLKPKWILTLGNEALWSVTGKSGIMNHRGKTYLRGKIKVIPTISPQSVSRNPGQRGMYTADLEYMHNQIEGKASKIKKPETKYILTVKQLAKLKRRLGQSELLSFDVETFSTPAGSEFAPDAEIISLSGCNIRNGQVEVWAIPLSHPGSPFRKSWKKVLLALRPELISIPKVIAHNGKYDCRWMNQFGVEIEQTFDTMLAVHLVNENLLKSLKFQAQNRFGVEPWAIDTKDLRKEPMMKVLEYNALDSYYTYHIYLDVKRQMTEQPRLARVLKFIMMPANNILVDVERRGVYIDRERLTTRAKIANDMRDEVDKRLMEFVPDPEKTPDWPRMGKGSGKLAEVNFNPSIFMRWLLFDHLGLPIIARGKPKDDGRPGDPSMAEAVMLELREEHPIVKVHLERTKWQKYVSSFFSAYEELLDENDRIHTTFKLYGTVTGRLSSGKAEKDKVTARAPIRGVNLQQVPRDPFVRGLFGAAPGYTFVEADFSQVELRVVAFLSRDRTMLHLYQTGQDIHRATAAWVLGVPASQVTGDDRKKAKAVNFGFVYGMYPKKFVATAFEKYDMVFSLKEAEDVRKAYFDQFKGLLPWHARQKRLVQANRRVVSPFGRVRHLPDIDSPEKFVRMEAERQAINSPVQSFASDMTMLSMVKIQEKLTKKNIDGHFICTVHDSLMFEIREKHLAQALPIIKDTMENLPLRRLFGVNLDVPIVSDLKIGQYWGDALELTPEEVYDYHAR